MINCILLLIQLENITNTKTNTDNPVYIYQYTGIFIRRSMRFCLTIYYNN